MKKDRKPKNDTELIRFGANKADDPNSKNTDHTLPEDNLQELIRKLQRSQLELKKQNAELRKSEVSFKESEAKHRLVLDCVPNNILEVNREGIILNSNGVFPEYKYEDIFGRNLLEISPKEHRDEIKMALEIVFGQAAHPHCQTRSLGKNGEMKWLQLNFSPLLMSGEVQNAIIVATDISERIYAAERQHSILNAAMDGFGLMDHEGYLIEVNDTFCQICGYSRKELLQMRISDLEFVELEEDTQAHLQMILEHGEDRFETKHQSKDGRIIDLEVSVQYQPVDGGQYVAFLRDITERKQTEKALRESDQRFRSYIDFAPHGIFVADETGSYVDVNPAASDITGYSKEELLSKKLLELIPEESLDIAANHFSRLGQEGFATGEMAYLRKEGSKAYCKVDAVKLSDQRFLGFVTDITQRKRTEEALSQSEALLKSVLKLLPVGVWILNEKGEITTGNIEAQNIWGEARYLGMEDFGEYKGWWPDSGKRIESHEWAGAKAIIKGEKSVNKEIEVESFDGTRKIILNSAVPIFNSDGSISGAIVTNQDITDRKQAEKALSLLNEELEARVNDRTAELLKTNASLQQAEEKYRTVADFTYGWEYWTDQDGNFLYCSPSCERITGYKVSDFLQNPGLLHEIVHTDDKKYFQCHKKKEDRGRDGNLEIKYRIITSDGSIRWIGHVCQPLFDESGQLIGTRGSNRDITQRIQVEQLLKTSNQKYKLLSENITDGIFIIRDGLFEYANKAMSQLFGYPGNELIGLKLTQLIIPDFLDELEIFSDVKVPLDRILNTELECIRKDLSSISVEFLFNQIGNEGVIYGVAHDITDKKQIQKNIVKAIIRTEEKERAYFSKELHDGLGPLLSTIKLYLQWSKRAVTNLSREEIIRKAEEILEEALTTAKEISNKLSPHLLTNHGLSSAIQSFVNKLKESSGIRINFESDVRRRLGDEIEAAIYRAIIECLNNTIKHAKAGNISILLNDADSQLLLHYTDDGIGFDLAETLSIKKGLGLFNLQNRIQTIGGKITMFSKPGEGVDYQITINH